MVSELFTLMARAAELGSVTARETLELNGQPVRPVGRIVYKRAGQ